ncbi:hypothetical protein CSKR_203010 [Clonorchis sinensis]|uniref:Uncharacterized protein n=1 Tax=Clonorchis sinensis TaxID=79923 RepID=A0A8T1M6Y3_CLOSI|nr:hypothetical protein CSKR_203010 [Clonorchis sinensis]
MASVWHSTEELSDDSESGSHEAKCNDRARHHPPAILDAKIYRVLRVKNIGLMGAKGRYYLPKETVEKFCVTETWCSKERDIRQHIKKNLRSLQTKAYNPSVDLTGARMRLKQVDEPK